MALKTLHSALLSTTFLILLPVAAMADNSALTAQQKYDALLAKGVFTGIDNKAGLDETMSRAQFSRVASLILGLEDISATDTSIVAEKPFRDVELGRWYTDEIAAFSVGNADGAFNVKSDLTVQELAVVTAGLLGLKAVDDAEVDGAADWAAGYIRALMDAGHYFPTNYTEAARRGDLVSAAFTADAGINPSLLASFDKSLLQAGYTATLSASGGEMRAISYYQDPSKASAAIFNPNASDADGLKLLEPGAAEPGGDRAFKASGAKLTLLAGCDTCIGWPAASGLTFGTYIRNPDTLSAEHSLWLLGPDISSADFGLLGADAHYDGAVIAYRIEAGTAPVLTSGQFAANYYFSTRSGDYAMSIESNPAITGTFSATDGKITGSGSTGMASEISGAFGKNLTAGDLLYGSFWAGDSTFGYKGVFAAAHNGAPPPIDPGPGPGPGGYSQSISWQISDGGMPLPPDVELAAGFYSGQAESSRLQVLSGGTFGSYTVNRAITQSAAWENGTESIFEGEMIGLIFDTGEMGSSSTAICSLGCDLMSWGMWEDDEGDLGYWITATPAASVDLTGGAEFNGMAYGFNDGGELSGAFTAEFDLSGMAGTFDIGGDFSLAGDLTVYDTSLMSSEATHYLEGSFTDGGNGMIGAFDFDFDSGLGTFQGHGVFGASRAP